MSKKNLKMALKPPDSISTGIAMVDMEVNRNYLADLETHNVLVLSSTEKVALASFAFVKITRIVSNKEEDFNEKLASVYSSLYTFFTSTRMYRWGYYNAHLRQTRQGGLLFGHQTQIKIRYCL